MLIINIYLLILFYVGSKAEGNLGSNLARTRPKLFNKKSY